MHDWRHRDPAVIQDDVRQHQQDHHDERHAKQPKNDRRNYPPTLHIRQHRLADQRTLGNEVPTASFPSLKREQVVDRCLSRRRCAYVPECVASGQVPAIAICCIAFSLLQAAPRTTDRSRKSNAAVAPAIGGAHPWKERPPRGIVPWVRRAIAACERQGPDMQPTTEVPPF
jgi:hypothetical protein